MSDYKPKATTLGESIPQVPHMLNQFTVFFVILTYKR